MITANELTRVLDGLLKPQLVKDYSPNGLQVQGKNKIKRIVTGVTASQALIDAAIERQADAILVHHGYFWKGESPVVTGMKQRRLKALLTHDISLYAYHLPIDIHPTLGNNSQLAKVLDIAQAAPLQGIEPEGIVFHASLPKPLTAQALADKLESALGRSVIQVADPDTTISTLAWCTGGGQGFIDQVAALGIDAFISGEISEQTTHSAREQGIQYFCCGHHATERYGVKAVGEYLQHNLQLDVIFIDVDNPA